MSDARAICLVDYSTRCELPAQLLPLTDAHLRQVVETWGPAFLHRYQQGEQDEDFLWDWPAKWRELAAHSANARGYVIECDDAIQGAMLLLSDVRCSRLSKGSALVYVDSVATAPWNRPLGRTPGRYQKVGSILLEQAIRESMDAGCEGRLGLHSLYGSDAFYRKKGFQEFGPDPLRRGKRYFELGPATRE